MRTVVLASCVLLSASSLASYELLAVADYAGSCIRRFDPVSTAYLGFFGGAGRMPNPTGVALDAATGHAYVACNGGGVVQTWDYSTGVMVSSFDVTGGPDNVSRMSSGDLLVTTTTGVYEYTTDGALQATWASGTGYLDAHEINGEVWTTHGTSLIDLNAGVTYTMAFAASWQFRQSGNLIIVPGAFNGSFNFLDLTTLHPDNYVFGASSPYRGIAPAHGTILYASNSQTILSAYKFGGTWNSGFNGGLTGQNFYAMDTVLAPEPASLLALALGGLALLRRRR